MYFAVTPRITVLVCDAFNALRAKLVPEERIHRVDHFLWRSTVFNLPGLRLANRIFEPL
ncbi:MAG: hypothetical protein LH475_13825 [Cryobacterium sp.]|uniref:hypothetical protein n=1 Tax=unclassified Cryobacterium TaxID=2649013 RepID=UPI0018CB43F5|nr:MULTISPECIES: hypothetical protein [unclassified Cryobacterium]MCY7405678.1 hypothetical protein [Cryobacterium sp.]MEC5155106.1 glucose-6-phosphate 1-dehydrogenase [Cryobacterium sp. CAN_C3]